MLTPIYSYTMPGEGKKPVVAIFAVYAEGAELYYGPGLRKHPSSVKALYRIRRGDAVDLTMGGPDAFSGFALIPCDAGAEGVTQISAPLDLGLFLHSLGMRLLLVDGLTEQEIALHLGAYTVVHALPAADALRPAPPPDNVVPLRKRSA